MALGGVIAVGLHTPKVVAVVPPSSSKLKIMRVVGAESGHGRVGGGRSHAVRHFELKQGADGGRRVGCSRGQLAGDGGRDVRRREVQELCAGRFVGYRRRCVSGGRELNCAWRGEQNRDEHSGEFD